MTKQEEIEMLQKFIDSIPKETYLYDALVTFKRQFEQAIRNDFSWALMQEML